MLSKNDCTGWKMPGSCFDCQCKILSDTYLEMIEAIDWQRFSFVEKNNKRGRPSIYSKIALLKALVYMELAGIPSVSKLVRILAGDLYKLEFLGFNQLPSESTFSRFKESIEIDRIMRILRSMIRDKDPDFMCMVGVDSTSLPAFNKTDPDAAWGYDHIADEMYYGYKIHLLYDLPTLAPICSVVTPANIHDTTQVLPLLEKMGSHSLLMNGLFADIAYDSREHIERLYPLGIPMINRTNRRNTKKELPRYRIQEIIPFHDITLNKLYKNRMHCEYTNYLLKEHLTLKRVKTTRILRVTVKTGLTLIARQIQVLYQVKQGANPRTTIIG
ncbi:transposase [Methanocella arvoryzae]|uniref:Predicted transposase (IS4) n=1 Tax=Methanocella arvoryzae (strain DSM 22066 / NBRC 105507 / MRE50) TaxID=351160 RepID=Q0W7V7_METAR|nr:transposase [Methanocella arvoryzae]CAJ35536.1 predicted transposase (IS4) [Methanocella arvoryzae MRE50]